MGEGDCSEALEVLYHYLDGELTADRRTLIRRHLDDCPPCVHAFDFEVELRVTIAHKCRERVPDTLRQRVLDALSQSGE
jgi:mycothiol system anti-sigma-R factor